MAAVTIGSDCEAQEIKVCHCFHFSPFYLPWSDRTGGMILVFSMLNFKPAFSFSFFTLIKRLFSSSSLSVIRVVSSAYLRLLIFLLAILIPACDSSSLAFHKRYSAYKLNKQGDNTQPCFTPFPILNYSIVPTSDSAAFWPAYRFPTREVKWSDIPISLRILPQFVVISQIATVKHFSIVSEAEVDDFLEFPCFLYDPTNVGNLISVSSAFSKPNLYIWKLLDHVLLKPSLKDFEHNVTPFLCQSTNCDTGGSMEFSKQDYWSG